MFCSMLARRSSIFLVAKWLKIAHGTPGAVYFSDADELMVLTRNGTSSPF